MVRLSEHPRYWNCTNNTRLRKMHEHNPHCIWCGILTVFHSEHCSPQPDNLATTEHIFTKKDSRRKRHNRPAFIALACHQCNDERGDRSLETFCKLKGILIDYNYVYY